MQNYPKSEVVRLEGVVHLADDFGGHVAGCAAGLRLVVFGVLPSHPEVGYVQVAAAVEHQVFGL